MTKGHISSRTNFVQLEADLREARADAERARAGLRVAVAMNDAARMPEHIRETIEEALLEVRDIHTGNYERRLTNAIRWMREHYPERKPNT